MPSPTRSFVTNLPKGHQFEPVTFTISAQECRSYLDAVGDAAAYGDALPPLAMVALALHRLQDQVALPSGALHTAQEVQHHGVGRAGDSLTLRGAVGARSERQGFVVTALDYEIISGERRLI